MNGRRAKQLRKAVYADMATRGTTKYEAATRPRLLDENGEIKTRKYVYRPKVGVSRKKKIFNMPTGIRATGMRARYRMAKKLFTRGLVNVVNGKLVTTKKGATQL